MASSSTRATHSATALPPGTAYATPASSSALVALRNRSLTFSAAMSALSHPTGPAAASAMIHASFCCLRDEYSTAGGPQGIGRGGKGRESSYVGLDNLI